jgi:hypothetical protein
MTSTLSAADIRNKTQAGPKIHLHQMRAWDNQTVAFMELNGLQIQEWDEANTRRTANDGTTIMDIGTTAEHMVKLCMAECDLDDAGEPVPGSGKRVFGDTRSDTLQVRNLGGALQESYWFCLKINQLRKIDDETMQKNSLTAPDSGSGATSPTDGDAQ